jgi:transposase-like protein
VVIIVQHYAGSVKQYSAESRPLELPQRCPACQASGDLIRWGHYPRWVESLEEGCLRLSIQRLYCKACGRTHSLLPDFVHPYRHYALSWIQLVVLAYLGGLGWRRLLRAIAAGLPRSTAREWVDSFAHGGDQLLDSLQRDLLELAPLTPLPGGLPPPHLARVADTAKRRRLGRAHYVVLLAEQLYALVKQQWPRLHFAADQLLAFLLHWLQNRSRPARLLTSPGQCGA